MTRREIQDRLAVIDVRISDLDSAIKDKEDELEMGRHCKVREIDGWYYSDSSLELINEIVDLKKQLRSAEDEQEMLEGLEPDEDIPPMPPTHTGAIFGRISQRKALAAVAK